MRISFSSQLLGRDALGTLVAQITQSAPAGVPRARVQFDPSLVLQTFDASQVAAFTLWNLTDKLAGTPPTSLELFPLQNGRRDLRVNFTGDPITVMTYALGTSTPLQMATLEAPPNWSVPVPFFGPF